MEEEAQPIQTVLRGIQQTKPGRGAFSQQQTRPPRPQLTQVSELDVFLRPCLHVKPTLDLH